MTNDVVFPEGIKPPEVRIDEALLAQHLVSKKFQRVFWQQFALIQQQTDTEYELGFDYLFKPDGSSIQVIEHEEITVGGLNSGRGGYKRYKNALITNHIPIINCHFHPESGNELVNRHLFKPSLTDLHYLRTIKHDMQRILRLTGFPISIIASPIAKQAARMFMFQATLLARPTKGFDTDMDYVRSDDELQEAMTQWGYKTAFITYGRDGILGEDKLKLDAFAFTLKPYQPKK